MTDIGPEQVDDQQPASPTEDTQHPTEPDHKGRGFAVAGAFVLVLGVAAFVGRGFGVAYGVLYGTSAVARIDWIIGALLAFGTALIFVRRPSSSEPSGQRTGGQRLGETLAVVTALASVITLVVTALNLFEPPTPPSVATAPCPGVPVRYSGEPYIGLTAGAEGNNSRTGPSSSFSPNGRFPGGCSIAFEYYCIGQPVDDRTGSTALETWATSRWLVIARQHAGFPTWLARLFSHEIVEDRYVSDAFVTPQSRYDTLRYGGSRCQDYQRYPLPGKATLQQLVGSTLTARASHAVNMGFALWVPGNAGFSDVAEYRQIRSITKPGPGRPLAAAPEDNPGRTDNTGSKSVLWQFQTVTSELTAKSGTVAVLAIPCLADNIPADLSTMAVTGYQVTSSAPPRAVTAPTGFEPQQLARIACSAST